MISVRYRYVCDVTHFGENGRFFKKGLIYIFTSDPGENFTQTNEDPLEFNTAATHIDSDGTVYFAGNVYNYDDWKFPLSAGKRGNLDKPDYDYDENGFLFPQNDTSEVLYFTDISSHRMMIKPGAFWFPHVHIAQAADVDEPVFEWRYRITKIGSAFGAFSDWVATTGKVVPFDSDPTHQLLEFPKLMPFANETESVSVCVDAQLRRNDNAVTGDVLTKQFDIHVPFDSPLGSGQQFIK